MKLFLITLLTVTNLHADEVSYIKNDYHEKYVSAEKLLNDGNSLESIQKLKKLLNVDKQNEIYLLNTLSKAHTANKSSEKYIAFLSDKIEKSPFDPNLNLQLIKEYMTIQKPAEACEKAKFMLPHVASKYQFHAVLADCSLANNRLDETVIYLDKLISERHDVAINLKRAEVHLKLNNLNLAKSDLDIYFSKAKPIEKSYLLQAELLTKQKLTEKTTEVFSRCLNTLKVSQPCFVGYLNATQTQPNAFKAEHYIQNISAYQNNSTVVLEIARYYQQLKNFDLAEKMFTTEHLKNPNHIEPVKMLFNLYHSQNQSQKAFDLLSRFIANSENVDDALTAKTLQEKLFQKQNPTNVTPAVTQTSARTDFDKQLYQDKKYSEILERLKKVKTKSDTDYLLLGNIYYYFNSYGNAKSNWGKVSMQSSFYHKARFNSAVLMHLENMKTAVLKIINSSNFPSDMQPQVNKFTELLGQYPNRLPAGEQKKIDELFKALLYLDWEQ